LRSDYDNEKIEAIFTSVHTSFSEIPDEEMETKI